MSKKPTLYIAYGSNMNLPQMAHRCPTAQVVGTSELKDYELLFRGGKMSAVATVEPKEGNTVPVLIWQIHESDELSLDRYEGYPNFYGKQSMEVELNGQSVSAMVYVMTPGHDFGIPSDFYINTIWEGYESAGLDTQILENAVEKAIILTAQQKQNQSQFNQQTFFGFGGLGE